MGSFKCPWCKRIHFIANWERKHDYICTDSQYNYRLHQNIEPTDKYTRGGWNNNHFSTREDAYKDVTVRPGKEESITKPKPSVKNY